MKKTKITYWVFTILFGGFMLFSAMPDLMNKQDAIQLIHTTLGYPSYFVQFIGFAKVLGVIALFIPGFPKLKEWAYAGLMFDLIGATYSCAVVSNGKDNSWMLMFIFIALGFAAYYFYHRKLKAEASNANLAMA
jgi:hypothetical protein